MSGLADIKSRALAERVADRIFAHILSEQLPVGTKLPNEYRLAELFGVGRSTVREAVRLLIARGILQVRHGSGTYVVSVLPVQSDPLGLSGVTDKLKLALDMTDVRLILEPSIAELAALHRTEEEAVQLRRCCAAVTRRIRSGEDYLAEDSVLHAFIAQCSHNMVLAPLLPIIDASVPLIANITGKQLLEATVETHEQIVQCIEEKDSVGARAAMAMHLTLNRNFIKQVYSTE